MFNFWRKFIKKYPQRTANMRHLLSKDVEFRWTEECQQEFNYLKECLTADPILQPINPDKDLVIMTDASGKE